VSFVLLSFVWIFPMIKSEWQLVFFVSQYVYVRFSPLGIGANSRTHTHMSETTHGVSGGTPPHSKECFDSSTSNIILIKDGA
jgi:hypothetical protein